MQADGIQAGRTPVEPKSISLMTLLFQPLWVLEVHTGSQSTLEQTQGREMPAKEEGRPEVQQLWWV